jgi:hypothetical protein
MMLLAFTRKAYRRDNSGSIFRSHQNTSRTMFISLVISIVIKAVMHSVTSRSVMVITFTYSFIKHTVTLSFFKNYCLTLRNHF